MTKTKVTVDLTRISQQDFAPDRPLRVATVRGGQILDQQIVTPSKEKNPRSFDVELALGPAEDGVAGAHVVVAPADDERNVLSKLAVKRFVSGSEDKLQAGLLTVDPGIYRWWRFCWFPRSYRITGRVVHHGNNCANPIGGATVEIYDVDYCWWWFDQDLIKTGTTDANGFFDITFTWCIPLWCFLEVIRRPPILVDPNLRDRLLAIVEERVPVKFPPPPPPPDPLQWERQLSHLGVELPASRNLQSQLQLRSRKIAPSIPQFAETRLASTIRTPLAAQRVPAATLKAVDLFRDIIFWPFCDDPCDGEPDVKIRVTQNQPGGSVVIYEDTYAQIHWDLDGDLLDLVLEANSSAIYADGCRPEPLLGNCMLFERVGDLSIMPELPDLPLSGIFQPDVAAGSSYGLTPDRHTRLGYVRDEDRPWAGSISVHGRFGIAAHVDFYQVQVAQWTAADFTAWDADHTHVPPDAAFAPVSPTSLEGFIRAYLEERPLPLGNHWPSEPFSPQTVAGIPGLYKSRERFELEYRNAHGGSDPAPDFGGWYWNTVDETTMFVIDSSTFTNGLYTFRLSCYTQTGVDGSGNPILALVNMALAGGIGKRCQTANKPELVTLYLYDHPHAPDCRILTFTQHFADPSRAPQVIDECAMVNLSHGDYLELRYQAFDAPGNLGSYGVSLQKGFSTPQDIRGALLVGAGVTITGSAPQGPTYDAALADLASPAIPPYWSGGTWTATVPYGAFVAMGGSCAYNLRVGACDRHTNGVASGCSIGGCEEDRAFTVILV